MREAHELSANCLDFYHKLELSRQFAESWRINYFKMSKRILPSEFPIARVLPSGESAMEFSEPL